MCACMYVCMYVAYVCITKIIIIIVVRIVRYNQIRVNIDVRTFIYLFN